MKMGATSYGGLTLTHKDQVQKLRPNAKAVMVAYVIRERWAIFDGNEQLSISFRSVENAWYNALQNLQKGELPHHVRV